MNPRLSRRGAKNGMAKLTEVDIDFIRSSDWRQKELARQFSVNRDTIRRIQYGLAWKAAE